MRKTWQMIALLGTGCFLFMMIQYLSTLKALGVQKEFQIASEKIKTEFYLERVHIIRFQKPEQYRIIITPREILPKEKALKQMEKIGLFFKKNFIPLSTTGIKVLSVKEVSHGCSSQIVKLEKTLDTKDTKKILLPHNKK